MQPKLVLRGLYTHAQLLTDFPGSLRSNNRAACAHGCHQCMGPSRPRSQPWGEGRRPGGRDLLRQCCLGLHHSSYLTLLLRVRGYSFPGTMLGTLVVGVSVGAMQPWVGTCRSRGSNGIHKGVAQEGRGQSKQGSRKHKPNGQRLWPGRNGKTDPSENRLCW